MEHLLNPQERAYEFVCCDQTRWFSFVPALQPRLAVRAASYGSDNGVSLVRRFIGWRVVRRLRYRGNQLIQFLNSQR